MLSFKVADQNSSKKKWNIPQDVNLRVLMGMCALLNFFSFLAVIFKAISLGAWRQATQIKVQTIFVDGIPRGQLNFYGPNLFDTESTKHVLIWVSISFGLAISMGTGYLTYHAATKGPIKFTSIRRFLFHAFYHANYIFPIAVFIFTMVNHARSDHFDPKAQVTPFSGNGSSTSWSVGGYCEGLCDGDYEIGRFDLSTWACDLHRTSEVKDPRNIMGLVCVGESATRGFILIIGMVLIGIACLMELDRRGARRLITTWKHGEFREIESDYI